jgi:hypothetical protein
VVPSPALRLAQRHVAHPAVQRHPDDDQNAEGGEVATAKAPELLHPDVIHDVMQLD